MRGSCRVLTVVLTVTALACAVRAEGDRRRGEVRGTFVKLIELQVGEREYVGVVVKPFEGKGEVVVLMSRQQREILALARKLEKGQKVEIAYVTEEGHKWVKRLEAERRRESGQGDLAELRKMIERMQARLKQLEREVVELREENARLRRKLAEKEADDGFPASLRGFRGMMVGTVKSKLDRGFVLTVEKVVRVWKANRAERPRDAVGKALTLVVGDGRMAKDHLKVAGGLKVGDRVSVEAFHFGGEKLTIVEELRKVD